MKKFRFTEWKVNYPKLHLSINNSRHEPLFLSWFIKCSFYDPTGPVTQHPVLGWARPQSLTLPARSSWWVIHVRTSIISWIERIINHQPIPSSKCRIILRLLVSCEPLVLIQFYPWKEKATLILSNNCCFAFLYIP